MIGTNEENIEAWRKAEEEEQQRRMREALRDILRRGGAHNEAEQKMLAVGQRWAAKVSASVNDKDDANYFRAWRADYLTLARDLLWSRTDDPAKAEDLDGIAARIASARQYYAQAEAEARVADGITAAWARGELDGAGDDGGLLDVRLAQRRIEELIDAEYSPLDLVNALREAIDLGLPDDAAQVISDAFYVPDEESLGGGARRAG